MKKTTPSPDASACASSSNCVDAAEVVGPPPRRLVSVVGAPRLCFPPFFPVLHRASDEDDADTPRSCAYRAHLAAKAIASRLARHMLAQTLPTAALTVRSFCPQRHALTQDLTVPSASGRFYRPPAIGERTEDADAMATALQPPEDLAKHPCKKMRLGGRQNALPEEFCMAST